MKVDTSGGIAGINEYLGNSGLVDVLADSTLAITSPFANFGTFALESGGNLAIGAGQTLAFYGGGNVLMNGGQIYESSAGSTLLNYDNTISGHGTLGNAMMSVENDSGATINATRGVLSVGKAGRGKSITNAGVMEATAGGVLNVNSDNLVNSGVLKVSGGGIINDNSFRNTGAGDLDLAGGTINLSTKTGNTVHFERGTTNTLGLNGVGCPGAIYGFAAGDTIDIHGLAFTKNMSTGVWSAPTNSETSSVHQERGRERVFRRFGLPWKLPCLARFVHLGERRPRRHPARVEAQGVTQTSRQTGISRRGERRGRRVCQSSMRSPPCSRPANA